MAEGGIHNDVRFTGEIPNFEQVTGIVCDKEDSTRRPQASCRLMLYANTVSGIWLVLKRGEEKGKKGWKRLRCRRVNEHC